MSEAPENSCTFHSGQTNGFLFLLSSFFRRFFLTRINLSGAIWSPNTLIRLEHLLFNLSAFRTFRKVLTCQHVAIRHSTAGRTVWMVVETATHKAVRETDKEELATVGTQLSQCEW